MYTHLIILWIAISLIAFFTGLAVGASILTRSLKVKIQRLENTLTEMKKSAEERVKQASTQARQQVMEEYQTTLAKEKQRLEEEISRRKKEVEREESRYREQAKKSAEREKRLDERERALWQREKNMEREREAQAREKSRIEALRKEADKKLEFIAQLSREEARAILLKQAEEEARMESLAILKRVEEETRQESQQIAQKIITMALQQCDLPQVVEDTSVTTVALPSDEMKGRIIGREGRNIRSFEMATGVDLIVDDTPEVVMLSCFDPVRRQVAAMALKRLIQDGRIHPARIEQTISWAQSEVDKTMQMEAEKAALEAGVHNLHPEILKLLGRLYFRTSYGQNVLWHSVEVAKIAVRVASELQLDVEVARRGALLHDIGKALDSSDSDAPHAVAGGKFAEKYGESARVANAIAAHHEEVPFESSEAVVVLIADSVSALRPGARKESIEKYLQRLKKLEEIVRSFQGVRECYAVSAGREIRIIVEPDQIGDAEMVQLSRDVARRIEREVTFPGQIKVTVIREKRAVEIAK